MTHKNQFIRIITLGLVVLFLSLAGCAVKKPMWGDQKTGFILKYSIAPDQILNYKKVIAENQTMEMMGQSMETLKNINMDYSIKGTGTDNLNNLLAQVNINDLNINMKGMEGERDLNTSGLKGKSFGISFSQKGMETDFIGIDSIPKIDFGQMSGGEQSVQNILSNPFKDLSDRPIKVGETWTDQKEYKVQQGSLDLTFSVELTNVLEGLETIKGMECARIKTQEKGTITGTGNNMGMELKYKGDLNSTYTWYFAYKEGLFVKGEGDEGVDANIAVGGMGDIPIVTKTKTETELIL